MWFCDGIWLRVVILKVLCSILRGLSVISSLDMGVCGEIRGFSDFLSGCFLW